VLVRGLVRASALPPRLRGVSVAETCGCAAGELAARLDVTEWHMGER